MFLMFVLCVFVFQAEPESVSTKLGRFEVGVAHFALDIRFSTISDKQFIKMWMTTRTIVHTLTIGYLACIIDFLLSLFLLYYLVRSVIEMSLVLELICFFLFLSFFLLIFLHRFVAISFTRIGAGSHASG